MDEQRDFLAWMAPKAVEYNSSRALDPCEDRTYFARHRTATLLEMNTEIHAAILDSYVNGMLDAFAGIIHETCAAYAMQYGEPLSSLPHAGIFEPATEPGEPVDTEKAARGATLDKPFAGFSRLKELTDAILLLGVAENRKEDASRSERVIRSVLDLCFATNTPIRCVMTEFHRSRMSMLGDGEMIPTTYAWVER